MRVYIAGPYSANNVMAVLENMRRGMRAATELFLAGFHPFVPWFDYHFVLQSRPDTGEEGPTLEDYYSHGLDWLGASDVLYVLNGYEESVGTLAEIEYARKHNIPIHYEDGSGVEGLKVWKASLPKMDLEYDQSFGEEDKDE